MLWGALGRAQCYVTRVRVALLDAVLHNFLRSAFPPVVEDEVALGRGALGSPHKCT